MKRHSIAVIALLAVVLRGCAGAPEPAPSEPVQASESAVESAAPVEPPEPTPEITAAPVEVTPTIAPDPSDSTDEYVLYRLHRTLATLGVTLTDEEALGAVAWVCEQRAADVDRPIALEGLGSEENYTFESLAEQFRCPEYF